MLLFIIYYSTGNDKFFAREGKWEMEMLQAAGQAVVNFFEAIYALLWGDLVTIPLPGGSSLGLSLLVIILIPAGIYFTIRTRFLPFRLFPEMLRVTAEGKGDGERDGIPACRH